MNNNPFLLWVFWVGVVSLVKSCPNHCFCYMWRDLVRTDCVARNLFNTFVNFPFNTQVLDLSENVISVLHGNEFLDANLRQIQDLRISRNKLHQISKFSFNGLEFLTHLDLSQNFIEYLNSATFQFNFNLKTLNLSYNPLTFSKENPFFASTSLQILDMANCHQKSLSKTSFFDLKQLLILNISRNSIINIESGVWDGIKNLRYLDLSENNLPCDDQTKLIIEILLKRGIEFKTFCKAFQKLMMAPELKMKNVNTKGTKKTQENFIKNISKNDLQHTSTFSEISHFFQRIPTWYAIIGGIQLGIFIGSFSTYICLRKSFKRHKIAGRSRNMNRRRSTTDFSLVSSNEPPGTPPSPYHSRYFSSDFSLSVR